MHGATTTLIGVPDCPGNILTLIFHYVIRCQSRNFHFVLNIQASMLPHCSSCWGGGDISVVIRRHYFSLSHPKNRICRAGRADRKQLHLLSDFPSDSVPNDRYILPPMQCVSNSRMPRPTNNYTAAAAGTASVKYTHTIWYGKEEAAKEWSTDFSNKFRG